MKPRDLRLYPSAGIGCLIAGLLAFAAPAARAGGEKAALLDPRDHRIGRLIPDLSFTDIDGKPGRLSQASGKAGLIIAARDSRGSVSKAQARRLEATRAAYAERGLGFLYLDISAGDRPEDRRAEVERHRLGGRYAIDADHVISAALGLTRSSEVFVLDRKRTLVYRGAIADAETDYLSLALKALLADEAVRFSATSGSGRAVALRAKAPAAAPVTWHNRVSRIVQQNCAECHREGENAPFPLRSYRDVKGYRDMIARVVADKSMPPWFADPKVGHWQKNRSLSEADRGDVLSWLEAGLPRGEAADAPVRRKFVEGWRIGQPDAVLQINKAFDIPAEGTIRYQYTTLKTDFPEDRWVEAVEIRPGAPEVVHHVLIWVRYPPGHPLAKGRQINRRGYFAGMAPGEASVVFPKDSGKLLPKGATLIFQLHYTANGVATKDQTRVGLRFRDSKPKYELRTSGVSNPRFKIPPGDANYKIVAQRRLKQPTRILSFSPHMHVRGKAFKYEAILPDKRVLTICNVPAYDFNWQFMYWLREPLDLPTGTVIRCTAWYDNSDKNPANPDPKATVTFGEQTWDEMMIGFYNGHILDKEPELPSAKEPEAKKPAAEPKPETRKRFFR